MAAISTTTLIAALVAMRTAMLGTSLVKGGWQEVDANPHPIWPYAEFDVETSSWDRQTFIITETIHSDESAAGRTIADTIVSTLDGRSYQGTGVYLKSHLITDGPKRRRAYEQTQFVIVWEVVALWH